MGRRCRRDGSTSILPCQCFGFLLTAALALRQKQLFSSPRPARPGTQSPALAPLGRIMGCQACRRSPGAPPSILGASTGTRVLIAAAHLQLT